ncbi:phage head morphogenesis protein, SPP1 gp7 family [Thioalkalivibrio sulfidiphilus HL-EbGr7]|uniref:Phage head morphogenesis protein, SPP1 gp7 family n=1 Tax=Thioalkalivibrio sulfidiphilus (strain HL-EbGR7) TaxID=396588 RepID=B8GL14_THISH|nr:phage minor head protein [Thioalkalivibrio sulfidiphilus]ACL71532.1 phage head morphogenesis protein, SPP1 gp7 family [Thioalkalivibrio sulfidiphilus HL-EbGr7]
MAETPDLGYALRLRPAEAIEYFEGKGYEITWNWWELWEEAHSKAFTVAKLARQDVLEDIRGIMSRTFERGMTEREFIRVMEQRLQAAGWWGKKVVVDADGAAEVVQEGSVHRLKTIYRTNTQTAYNVGRYRAQADMARARPYWQYIAVMDARTRPSHAALHLKVFRYDDPIWSSIYPPNGFNCRCRVSALSDRDLERDGLEVESSAGQLSTEVVDVGTDKRTGEVIQRPVTVWSGKDRFGRDAVFRTDPGWNYNPGEAWTESLDELERPEP